MNPFNDHFIDKNNNLVYIATVAWAREFKWHTHHTYAEIFCLFFFFLNDNKKFINIEIIVFPQLNILYKIKKSTPTENNKIIKMQQNKNKKEESDTIKRSQKTTVKKTQSNQKKR